MRILGSLLIALAVSVPASGQGTGRRSPILLEVCEGRLIRPAPEKPKVAPEDVADAEAGLTPIAPSSKRSRTIRPLSSRVVSVMLPAGDIGRLVAASAARHRVDPRLIAAVINQESGFKTRAVSSAGACGLMQLMPATARRFGVRNIFNPAENIDGGVRYLRWLLDTFDGRVDLALAGYNAGEGRVIDAGYRVPAIRETRHYVRAIQARYPYRTHP